MVTAWNGNRSQRNLIVMTTSPQNNSEYHCPLCVGHDDYEFVWHELAQAYVCFGCRCEIDCGLDFEQQPTADDYNCYDTI